MTKIIGIISGLSIFGYWMNIVGNPHVVETILGMIISIICGYVIFRESGKLVEKYKKS